MKRMLVVVAAMVTLPLMPEFSAAQLGGRPAEEWAIVLESGRRMEGLEIENVVRALELERGSVVADIGAGTGIFSVPLASAVGPSGTVLAVEVDAGFLPMIDEKAHSSNVHNVQTVLGEYEDPKLPRNDIQLAFFHDVLHHIQDRQGYIRALDRYMAPGSRVAIVDYNARHPATPHQDEPAMLITPEDVDGWMREAGYLLEEEVELFEEKFYRIYRKR